MAEVELPDPEELREHAENKFSRRVALVTAVFAVVLAIAALGGNHAMKEMLLAQQQSSDQWAFYQAKVIREHLYRAQKMRVEVDLAERGAGSRPEAREKLEALFKKLEEEEKRYNAEKKDILARSPLIFSFSLVLAVVGAGLTANGYFPLFQLPFLHGSHH